MGLRGGGYGERMERGFLGVKSDDKSHEANELKRAKDLVCIIKEAREDRRWVRRYKKLN